MYKAEPKHNHSQNQPAHQIKGSEIESPQGEQIAQLENMVENSPATGKQAQLVAMIGSSPAMAAQRKIIKSVSNSPYVAVQRKKFESLSGDVTQRQEDGATLQEKPDTVQRNEEAAKPNNTGLPDNLKTGIESLSGLSMDNVKVHYNSSQPAQLNALAYAQGSDIHIAPGQEQHLPHEAWHVVQQAQGRVQSTMQMRDGVPVNDDAGLEREADDMGKKAVQIADGQNARPDPASAPAPAKASYISQAKGALQRVVYPDMDAMWAAVAPNQQLGAIHAIIQGNPALSAAYNSMAPSLQFMNFVAQNGRQPEASLNPNNGLYDINYGPQNTQQGDFADDNRFAGAVIHEMMHIHTALSYQNNVAAGSGVGHGANMHLPAPQNGEQPIPEMGFTMSQVNAQGGLDEQTQVMAANWEIARTEVANDLGNQLITQAQSNFFNTRIDYAENISDFAHYDTVLVDVLYYLEGHGLQGTRTYEYTTRMLDEANNRRAAGQGLVANIAQAPQPQPQPQPQPRGWCYITTACVTYRGLDDNCEELTLLREFRDNYLVKKKDGIELLKLYYDYAPMIVQRIARRRREEEEEIYERIYKVIKQCVDEIKRGNFDLVFTIYFTMVLKLKKEYLPELIDSALPEV